MRRIIRALVPVAALLCAQAAVAERVLVHSGDGEEGHAWLFGSRGPGAGECWLAVPLHVISKAGRVPKPFTFTDRSGRSGESSQPIGVESVPAALEAAAGIRDLAFARAVSGRKKGECLSRLGLPPYAYDAALRRSPELTVFNLLPTSFGIFKVVVSRAGVSSGGGKLELKPLRREDADNYLKQGLSGAVAEISRTEGTLPFAMVLQADARAGTAWAIRFDLIRSAFAEIEAFDRQSRRQDQIETEGVPYRIVEFDGLSLEPSTGPSSLNDPGTCWRVAPRGGRAQASIIIELSDPTDRISAVAVVQIAGCGDPSVEYTIDQRVPNRTDWIRAARCSTVEDASRSTCYLDLGGPRQLRISIPGPRPAGLSAVTLR